MFLKKRINYFFCTPFKYTDIPDIARQKTEYTYFGGLLLWIHFGEELRTIYLIDVAYGRYRSWDNIEITLTFTDMPFIDPTYTEPECVTAGFYTYRLETAEELRDLVSTSKKEMYHIINTDWDGPAGWLILSYGRNWTRSFAGFTDDDIVAAITQTEGVAELIGDVVDGVKSDKELLQFIKEKNLTKHVWFADIDLRSWSDMSLRP